MVERVAVIFAEGAFGGGADMGEDEAGSCLRGDAVEVGAVPRGDSRGEEAWSGAELRIGVEAYSETIGVVLATSSVLQTTRRLARGTHEGSCDRQQASPEDWKGGRGIRGEAVFTRRRRESNDCLRIEWLGSRISLERRISSLPL